MIKGPRHLGRYELREHLGHGGIAEAWKAFDPKTQRYVTIKIFHSNLSSDPNFLRRFEDEAEDVVVLEHANIARTYEFKVVHEPEEEHATAYIVSQYIEGPTLTEYLKRTSRAGEFPPDEEVIHLFTGINAAVDYAHRHGLAHHAIHPGNIRLDQHNTTGHAMGEPMLIDLGIARLLKHSTGKHSNRPHYLSPEQARDLPGDERSDIYSLGVILYEVYTGTDVVEGSTPTAIIKQQIDATPKSPSLINQNVSPELEAVILRCLEKDLAMRYATVSEMSNALIEALKTPGPEEEETIVPVAIVDIVEEEETIVPVPIVDIVEEPTVVVTEEPVLLGVTQPAPVEIPVVVPEPIPTDATVTSAPVTSLPPTTPAQVTPWTPGPKPASRRRWRDIVYIAIIIILLLLLLFLLLLPRLVPPPIATATPTAPAPTSPPVVNQPGGHIYFLSSGQINESSSQGIADELQIDLQNIPDPAAGKSYYAWLLPDKDTGMALLIGQLTVKQGVAHLVYKGDANHTNLFALGSRFVISEQNTSTMPSSPTADTWKFYGAISQTPSTTDGLSLLTHLRYLLSGDPILDKVGLPGGLNVWFFRNTSKIEEWATSARDDWTAKAAPLMHRHIIRILEYLDGTSFVQRDVPPGTPLLVDRLAAQFGLLSFGQNQQPPSYLDLVRLRLKGIVESPNLSPDQVKLIALMSTALDHVQMCLEQAHQDAKQLFGLTDTQLVQPAALSMLNDLFTQALCAFGGQFDPANFTALGGVAVIYNVIQILGKFDVAVYKA